MYSITLDGVLRSHDKSVIPEGAALMRALSAANSVAVMGSDNPDFDNYWIKINNLPDPTLTVTQDSINNTRYKQHLHLRKMGYIVSAVVEPDPEVIVELHKNGFSTLHFLSPSFTKPSLRPDLGPISPWAKMVEEFENDQRLRAGLPVLGESGATEDVE